MVWGVQRQRRSVSAALALLGVAFYALLLPWHLTSQYSTGLAKLEISELAGSICLSDGSSPAMPATGCPICKGLAAFQLAVASPETILPPPPFEPAHLRLALREDAVSASVPSQRNRGPPSTV
ncbi:DUF2946 domain-containing protein [Hyphomicrobium sp. 1Nfss2.1]|uniref:DUF2946 domain-containing protein n=1 Tax=Hyphomicrobium sp. 1Nfss2.1 TaxID=3413936 RepID=UPI003C7D53AE